MAALAAISLEALAGCGLSPDLRARLDAEAAGLSPAVADDRAVRELGRAAAAEGTPPPTAWPLPAGAGFDDYLRETLVRSPAIHRAIREAQALGARVSQVTSLDDPMITIVPPTDQMIETAAGMMDGSVGITQKITFPEKLGTRGRIAEQAVRIALDRLADVRIQTVATVRKAYWEYYLADVSIGLTRQSADLLQRIRDVAAARYRAGAATQQDVLRAEVELYATTNQLVTLEQRRATASARLNALMNRRIDAPLPPPKGGDLTAVGWRLDEVLARATRDNPRLAALRDQIERDLQGVKLARLQYLPDLTVGYSYTFIAAPALSPVATGDDAWNLGLGLNLPIWWQRLRAGVLEGNAQVLRSVEEYDEMRNLLFFGLEDALVRVDTQYRQGVLDRDVIVPRAWQAIEVSLSAYGAGQLDFSALVDAWRRWLDVSLAQHRAVAGLEQAFADLEQLIGVRIQRSPSPVAGPVAEGRVVP